ncbi:MAG: TRAP transporter small permease [Bacteroidales bacterium]|jgi:TRAP-type C4-dicarboxylate transport system permease small subunit
MKKFRKAIDRALEIMMVVTMIILMLDVLWQVASRYLNKLLVNHFALQIPTKYYAFTDELAGFLLIWVALLGSAYATGKKQHLAIDLLITKLGREGKIILSGIINFLIFLFAVSVLLVGGTWLVYTRFYLGQVSSTMEIPIGFVYLIVPLSGLLISYYAADDFYTLQKK